MISMSRYSSDYCIKPLAFTTQFSQQKDSHKVAELIKFESNEIYALFKMKFMAYFI